MIYIVKVYTRLSEDEMKETGQKLRLWDVKLFKNYEYAIGWITSNDSPMYEDLPEKYRTDFSCPHVRAGSQSGNGFSCDLEFCYEDTGVIVYIGEPLLEDGDETESSYAKALFQSTGSISICDLTK